MRGSVIATIGLGLLCGAGAIPAPADEPCGGFKGNVAREHALFLGSFDVIAAGKDLASAPPIVTEHLHALTLPPQSQVAFDAAPGKTTAADNTFAGILTFTVDRQGVYRVSLDAPLWIDVVSAGVLVKAKDYQGLPSCDSPHKIVAFDLPGAGSYVLQVSGSTKPVVRATVTRIPD